MYAEAGVTNAAIRERFSISDPTLYRVLQKQGVPLRGRSAQAGTWKPRAGGSRRTSRRGTRTRATRRGARAARSPRVSTASSNGSTTQFRVEFQVERVFNGPNIRDVLRQAQSAGASEIVAITRED
jgi:hypothetical protein